MTSNQTIDEPEDDGYNEEDEVESKSDENEPIEDLEEEEEFDD